MRMYVGANVSPQKIWGDTKDEAKNVLKLPDSACATATIKNILSKGLQVFTQMAEVLSF